MNIKKKDIPSVFTPENISTFNSLWEYYSHYKNFGLPYSGGFAEQPALVIDVIEMFISCEQERTTHGK